MRQLLNHLFSFRKRTALSQVEVAFLLGIRSSAKISKHERFAQVPSFQTALAYEIIYQKPVSELFPGLVAKIHAEVKSRAKIMQHQTFARDTELIKSRKCETVAAILSAEITSQPKQR